MPPPPRGQNKSQRNRENRNSTSSNTTTTPPPSTGSTTQQSQSRSGTTTPELSTAAASSNYVSNEVREYLHSKWQKYYDDAVSQEKNPNASTVLYTQQPQQQQGQGQQSGGWNTVGSGKGTQKGTNPWGTQNRNVTAKGVPFLQALKTAVNEQSNPQKGG